MAFGVESPGRLRHELHAQLTREAASPTPEFWSALRAAIEEFPAEPYFPLLGSSAALAGRQNALPWIAHALERSPASAPARMELARILQAHGRTSQALGALRQAIELNPAQARRVLALAAQWSLSDAEIAKVAPRGKAGAELLLLLAGRTKDGPTRIRLLERALEHDPARVEAHHRLGEQLWRELANPTAGSACAERREECLARAEQEVERGRMPGRSRSDVLRARLLVERGQKRQAEDYLAGACEQHAGDVDCVEELVALAFENESSRLPDAVRALVASACRNPEDCGAVHLKLGNRFSRASEWATAMAHYRQAAEETPSPATLLALARAAEHLGQPGLARDARRRAELLGTSASARGADDAPSDTLPAPPDSDRPKNGSHSAAP
jgi:tetratricopeptide (TPR) repeat protein